MGSQSPAHGWPLNTQVLSKGKTTNDSEHGHSSHVKSQQHTLLLIPWGQRASSEVIHIQKELELLFHTIKVVNPERREYHSEPDRQVRDHMIPWVYAEIANKNKGFLKKRGGSTAIA